MDNHGLRVSWHETWNGDLEHALNVLPEMEMCPRDLYRDLLALPGPAARKKIALVSRHGTPVALIGMRRSRNGRSFEPITNWLTPGPNFPCRPDMMLDALGALNLPVRYGWWRMPLRPQVLAGRDICIAPTYGMSVNDDFEAFWARTRELKDIRIARRRCARLRHAVDPPGATEWLIRNWDKQWSGEPDERASVGYRLKVAEHLKRLNLHVTQALLDGDTLVGAATQIVHGDTAVASLFYCLPEYRNQGVPRRLIELHFQHAREAGLAHVDLGGAHHYKAKWAPINGERADIAIWPRLMRSVKGAADALRGVRRRFAEVGASDAATISR